MVAGGVALEEPGLEAPFRPPQHEGSKRVKRPRFPLSSSDTFSSPGAESSASGVSGVNLCAFLVRVLA